LALDRRLPTLGLILAGALALAGCRAEKPSRLVLIGMDGGSWTLLDPMIQAGELPHFQGLIDRGVSADLASVEPLFSPPVWTSIATGRSPAAHGVDFFYANRFSIKVPTIWERLSAGGVRVGLYDYLVTWPPREYPGGFVVPGWLRRNEAVWPPDLFQKIGIPRYAYSVVSLGGPEKVVANSERELVEKPRTWNRLWKEMKPDVGAVTFYALDVMGHRFWQKKDVMRRTALGMDRALGEILASLGPDDNVLIASDHGFQLSPNPSRRWGFDARWLLEQGGIGNDGITVVSEWVNMTLRINPGPEAQREATLARLGELFGSIRATDGSPAFELDVVHVPERPSEARERPRMLTRTMQRLQPAYAFVVAVPIPDSMERIGREGIVGIGGRRFPAERFATAHDFTGEHNPVGIFLAAGKAIRHRPGRARLSVLDIAPLMTYLAGQPIPGDFEGRLTRALLDPGYLERHPPRHVSAAQAPRLPAEPGMPGMPGAADSETEERLRALGYI
jgi:hypothetical protein